MKKWLIFQNPVTNFGATYEHSAALMQQHLKLARHTINLNLTVILVSSSADRATSPIGLPSTVNTW